MRIRRARPDDVSAMLGIKASLAFQETDGTSTQGGFLLGTDAEGYLQRIEEGLTWVMEDNAVRGFAIVLPDGPFRESEVWQRRDDVRWEIDRAQIESQRLGYYDQLAVSRGPYRRWSASLAFTPVHDLMLQGCDHLVTATVSKPVVNLAAVPFIERLDGRRVGTLDEEYPVIGQLVSDIWLVPRSGWKARVERPVGRGEQRILERVLEAIGR